MNLADALADGHLEKALVFLRNFAAPENFEYILNIFPINDSYL